ncbi:DMT family transporter [Pseudalkalibacillus berkeleyi]|uniref:DMT family transporter n=1 Tax=Pseudalkalibacillus berkeleyi TaxID=1069813 RepID=A0ABS9GXD6_9BACL|nr:DMT family transporter [Pseudalkalibacillus berkeleyi]MCF6136326.1 DMT family transporter [Pseudalkalibacillus berkeleyi]
MKKWAYLFIALGASLWGLIAIFVEALYTYGFTALEIVTLRVTVAAVLLLIIAAIKDVRLLKINWRDSSYFIGTGIFSIVFFNWCLFTAIKETSIAVAAILLYTAPAIVTILSRFLFKEWFTVRKGIALLMTLFGCTFVIGVLPGGTSSTVSFYGVLAGLGSGLGYALYSIFGKYALKKYTSITVITYTFIFASVVLIPVTGLWKQSDVVLKSGVLMNSLGLGLISTVLAFMFYTVGLQYIESSRASITATVEPVVATLVGVILFKEQLTAWQIVGIALVLSAVIVVQENKKRVKTEHSLVQ